MMISQIKRPQRELCVRARVCVDVCVCVCVCVCGAVLRVFINLLFLFLLALLHKSPDYNISGNNINHQ